jgi:hypothetical protein
MNEKRKKRTLLFALMLGMFALVSCEKEELQYKKQFEKSYRTWLDFKTASGNSYRYKLSGSSWNGFSWKATITVTDGKVTQRYFRSEYEGQITEWTENENETGSHDAFPAPPLTLDEIYGNARNEWLIKRAGAQLFFETDNNGLISLCGYVENDCADDCFTGVRITEVEGVKNGE